ncbi:MAG TPA: sugar phosphate isomerase/epimerase [Firmicutes bacterium]|nr:sugar phosphate isomerase/epimerase [Bacillota bacterium]
MLIGLNGASTLEKADFEIDLRVAAAQGYDYLEIWGDKLFRYLERHSIAESRKLIMDSGVRPLTINAIDDFTFQDSAGFGRIKQLCKRMCSLAADLGCPYVILCPSPKPAGISPLEVRLETISALRELAGIAHGYGIGLAFEFLGFQNCSVRTLEDAWDIVREADCDNVGLVLDTFHWYAGGSSLDAIGAVDPSRIYVVHVNDSEDLPKDRLEDRHRLLPGDGVIPLKDILRSLADIGYEGVLSIELFRPEYWQWEPEKFARIAMEKTRAILDACGLKLSGKRF